MKRRRFKNRQESLPLEKYKFVDGRDYCTSNKGKGMASIIKSGMDKFTRERFNLQDIPSELSLRIKGPVPREFRGRQDGSFVREEIKTVRTRLGEYFTIISFAVQQEAKMTGRTGTLCSFDPGNRVFLSWYSEDGTCGEIGGSFAPNEDLLRKADGIKSVLARERNEGKLHRASWRRSRKRNIFRLLERVKCHVDDLHNKVASWVVGRFRLVFLPEFRTSEMASRPVDDIRVINSHSCRAMLTWSHYRFQQRLLDLSQRYSDVKVFLANEAMTTRQCGECGAVNEIGGAKVFTCAKCKLVAPRDIYSARRVLQRALPHIIEDKRP